MLFPPYIDIPNMPSTIPANPMKDIANMLAAINTDGTPLKASGISHVSILPLTPANSIMATMKPTPAPTAFTKD